jgi:hypothetical protein
VSSVLLLSIYYVLFIHRKLLKVEDSNAPVLINKDKLKLGFCLIPTGSQQAHKRNAGRSHWRLGILTSRGYWVQIDRITFQIASHDHLFSWEPSKPTSIIKCAIHCPSCSVVVSKSYLPLVLVCVRLLSYFPFAVKTWTPLSYCPLCPPLSHGSRADLSYKNRAMSWGPL